MAEALQGFSGSIRHRHGPALCLGATDDRFTALADGGVPAQSASERPEAEDWQGQRSSYFSDGRNQVNGPYVVLSSVSNLFGKVYTCALACALAGVVPGGRSRCAQPCPQAKTRHIAHQFIGAKIRGKSCNERPQCDSRAS